MSNMDADPLESECGGVALAAPSPPAQTLDPREVPLGGPRGGLVRRTLPHREIRTVGAWCFADHYGPVDLAAPDARPMTVPPHPHIGLQTVSWLLAGSVEHRDSVGSHQVVRPGELNLMTAGRGIAHSEYSTPDSATLFGVQLWVALPDEHRHQEPHFEHHDGLPRVAIDGSMATVLMGSFAGATSPAAAYTPIVGAELRIPAGGALGVPLERDFEYGVLVVEGAASLDGVPAGKDQFRYLGWGCDEVRVASPSGATLLLLGGEPLAEHLLMWWNFVGRDHEEIEAARLDWEGHRRFGDVLGDANPRMPAPPLPTTRMLPRPSRPQES